ncbi:MAG: RrF2 family transcriptional regulator [Planctomycetota bacterium]|jgi:Rrf2 family protein
MKISKKCQYALKAVFELAWRDSGRPVKTCNIAAAQRMSPRFTEIILNELRHGGYVESRRGNSGGYLLARDPASLTVREVIEYVQGPICLVAETAGDSADGVFLGSEAFKELWGQVNRAVCDVCDSRTFADLVQLERSTRDNAAVNFCI